MSTTDEKCWCGRPIFHWNDQIPDGVKAVWGEMWRGPMPNKDDVTRLALNYLESLKSSADEETAAHIEDLKKRIEQPSREAGRKT